MSADPNDACARDGCTFFPMLVPVGDWILPAAHCSHACADYVWLERTLAAAPRTNATPDALEAMEELRQLLDERQAPTDVGPLVEF
ncbi:hypothetical protein EDD98_6774 [Streptomyces sp. PanSC19]|uniref:hypothetical protein n=1 Tax=Streptomyces sp. PanSC19 TaxID=1520455 RepID=UPI000F48E483|nr:hypothetical protein [Streptomyces sp. PanSC19]ROQ27117.1 hypothetical protein EDD98_6774 [Streptomyces sp. PanSC19]